MQTAAGATGATRGGSGVASGNTSGGGEGGGGSSVAPVSHKLRLRQMEFEEWRVLLEQLSKTLFVMLLQIHTTHQKLSSVLTDLITDTTCGARNTDAARTAPAGHSVDKSDLSEIVGTDAMNADIANGNAGVASDAIGAGTGTTHDEKDPEDLNGDDDTNDPMYGMSEEDPGSASAVDAAAAQELAASALDILDGKAITTGVHVAVSLWVAMAVGVTVLWMMWACQRYVWACLWECGWGLGLSEVCVGVTAHVTVSLWGNLLACPCCG